MAEKSMVVLDFDDTIARNGHVEPRAMEVLGSLKESENIVGILTGSSVYSVGQKLSQNNSSRLIELVDFIGYSNGAYVYWRNPMRKRVFSGQFKHPVSDGHRDTTQPAS